MRHSADRLIRADRHESGIGGPKKPARHIRQLPLKALSAAVLSAFAWSAHALPETAQVTAGTGTIGINGSTMTIDQTSSKLSISWQKFNTAATESIVFNQPDRQAIALNRVIGNEPSNLLGKLSANGQVWLLNPNGVFIGQGATIDTGGLVATSLFISDTDFINGKSVFTGGKGASVISRGTITATNATDGTGGYAALLGGSVSNEGTITAKFGTVALAGGTDITLDFNGDKLLSARVDKGVVNALAQNKQLISADGGMVIMTAQVVNALLSTVVNNSGTIEARTLQGKKGRMILRGGNDGGSTTIAGKLDASSAEVADGGTIELSGAFVKINNAATITAASSQAKGGQLNITASAFTVAPVGTSMDSGMSSAFLKAKLADQNVSMHTAAFGTVAAGDIKVNDAVSWSANTALVLNSGRDLHINAPILNTGATASLNLAAIKKINLNADITLSSKTSVLSITPGANADGGYWLGSGVKVSLPSGADLTIAGEKYKVVDSFSTLQAMNQNLDISYALGSDVDLIDNPFFVPIGGASTPFRGNFEGFGHQIKNLNIDMTQTDISRADYVGLFSNTIADKSFRNIVLTDVYIRGQDRVGALMGASSSNIYNVTVSGEIVGNSDVGGLAGLLSEFGIAKNIIANPIAVHSSSKAGGLFGTSYGIVENAAVSGQIDAALDFAGGLIGVSYGRVNNVSATGYVFGVSMIGGMFGQSTNTVTNGVVNSTVSAVKLGGLVAGEIFGINGIESKNLSIENVYASGTVTLTQPNAKYDLFFGSITNEPLIINVKNVVDLFKKDNYPGLDFDTAWRIYDGHTAPVLRFLLKPVIVSADHAAKIYDGTAYSNIATGVSYSDAGAVLEGSLVYGDALNKPINVGTYGLSGLWSGSYDIRYGTGSLTIVPKEISASLSTIPTKIYDGKTDATVILASLNLAGLVAGESITAKSAENTGSYNSMHVNEARYIDVPLNDTTFTTGQGTKLSNYKLIVEGGITPKSLVIKANSVSKAYDGIAYSGADLVYQGFVGDEHTGVLSGTLAYGGTAQGAKNAGNYNITASGLSSGNYAVSYESGSLTIHPRLLTVSYSSPITKTYDGKTEIRVASSDFKLGNFVGSENIAALGTNLTGFFNSKNVNEARLVTIGLDSTNFKFSGGADPANYKLPDFTSFITPAKLSIQAQNDIKIYDGIAYAGAKGVAYSGFVNGEQSTNLIGVLSYTGDAQGAKNAGQYKIIPQGFSSNNYNITYLPGELTISPKTLVASVLDKPVKIYDGTDAAKIALSDPDLIGLVGGDTIRAKSTTVTGVYNSKNVNEANAVTIGLHTDNFVFGGSALSTNYQLASLSGKILPAALTIKANNVSKIYDGQFYAGGNGVTYSGLVNQETPIVLAGSLAYGGSSQNAKNAGQYSITASGLSSSNYVVNYQSGLLTIEPKSLTASLAVMPSKIYDGNTKATVELGNLELTGFVNDEIITAKNKILPGLYNSKNVNEATSVSVALTTDNFSIREGGQLSNYVLLTNAGKISPASLSIQPKNIFKTYDGKPFSGADLQFTGFVGSENSDVLNGRVLVGGTAQGAIFPGRYLITASGFSSDNYKLNYRPGVLSVDTGYYALPQSVISATTNHPIPTASSQNYSLQHSDKRHDAPLRIECRQLRSGRFGSAQCLPNVSSVAPKTNYLSPLAAASCKSCLPDAYSLFRPDSFIN